MGKYFKVFTVSVQNAMEYKENFICNILFSMIPCVTNLLLWCAIYKSGSQNLDMSIREMIAYYLFVLFVDNMTCDNLIWKIPQAIQYGDLNKYLMKPAKFRIYMLCSEISQNAVFFVTIGLPILILMFLFRSRLGIAFSMVNFFFFVAALIIGYIINFLLNYLVCMLAFYMTDVSSLCMSLDMLKGLLTGKTIPISLVPKALYGVLIVSPFQFICYFPIMVLLNHYTVTQMISQVLLGLFWIVVLYAASEIAWRLGLKRYSAVGG